jgi:hyaluronoglucosaminidase
MIDQLIPRPRDVRVTGPLAHTVAAGMAAGTVAGISTGTALPVTVVAGTAPGSAAWRALPAEHPEELPPGGYLLRIEAPGTGSSALIAAADEAGLFRARAVLDQLARAGGTVPALTLRDWPELPRRGVVEGFYGTPWSHAERLDFLGFAATVGLNDYIYAPKYDPFHRERWRDPYPPDELAELGELAAAARDQQVRFVYALAPGLSMRVSDPGEHELLRAKAGQLWDAGIRSFALLFDDVPSSLRDDADITGFGSGPRAAGNAHGVACSTFRDDFLLPRGTAEPLLVCPTDYSGCAPSPYRDGLRETLPWDALVMWTGAEAVVSEISRDDIDRAARSYGRNLMFWDNFPVNDFDRSRLFLGPLTGRSSDRVASALAGASWNPMVEAAASRFALATAADWAWNPGGYDPAASAANALGFVAGEAADSLRPLVTACSTWPPWAPQSPQLEEWAADALAGDASALRLLTDAFTALARAGCLHTIGSTDAPATVAPHSLRNQLGPWLDAARDAGRAGLLACALLAEEAGGGGPLSQEETMQSAVVAALQHAEAHYADVLRAVIPPFVRSALERTS